MKNENYVAANDYRMQPDGHLEEKGGNDDIIVEEVKGLARPKPSLIDNRPESAIEIIDVDDVQRP